MALADRSPLPSAGDAFIQVEGLAKEFAGRGAVVRALNGINLTIHPGEFVSVLGPSGCGKSTLMMLIAGLKRPSEGRVIIRGKPLERPYTDVGIVFQRDVLMEWRTVLGNVMVQADIRGLDQKHYRERAVALLEQVGLGEFLDRYPPELSGGMRQRVAICRALLHNPPLLLMDEPFGALDALTRERLMLDLQQIWDETRKTVVFVTHSISEAVFLSDRVIVMSPRPGQVVEDIAIDLERPRSMAVMNSPRFAEYAGRIRDLFHAAGVL